MRDYATFKRNGIICKEEILFWRQIDSNPLVVRFLTPSGLYKYEQTLYPEYEVKGGNKVPKVIQNNFYKFNGTDEQTYFGYSQIEKEIYTRWEHINDIESFTVSFPLIS